MSSSNLINLMTLIWNLPLNFDVAFCNWLEKFLPPTAITTEPFQNSNPDMELMFKEIDFESKRKAFNLFKNSNVKEQYSGKGVIAQEEILNAMRPLDSSPIIAPINSNS